MKSKLIRSKATETEPTYPALYKSTKSKLVVLAEDEYSGMVVVQATENGVRYRIGTRDTWLVTFGNQCEWTRLSSGEKVVLEND